MIYTGSVNRNHEDMLIGIPPYVSVSRAKQFLKGKSPHNLLTVSGTSPALLGPASVGERLLDSIEWERYRRGIEGIHQESAAAGAR